MNVMDWAYLSTAWNATKKDSRCLISPQKQMLPDKYQLASSRLYYTVKSDVCQCFRCHVKLSEWDRNDEAIKQHYKSSSNCDYIKLIGVSRQKQTWSTFGVSPQMDGFGTGSSNFMRRLDQAHSQNRWDNASRDGPIRTVTIVWNCDCDSGDNRVVLVV